MSLVRLFLLVLPLICVFECRGGRGGGFRGGSRGFRTSRTTSARTRYTGTRYYSRSNYRKSDVLTYMTLWSMSNNNYHRASYYRYPVSDPEYCLYCNASSSNNTCTDQRNVCQQSSDCYFSTYNDSEGIAYIDKGCLWDPYGLSGCDEVVKNCTARGMLNCKCSFCSQPFCNHTRKISLSSAVFVLSGLLRMVIGQIIK